MNYRIIKRSRIKPHTKKNKNGTVYGKIYKLQLSVLRMYSHNLVLLAMKSFRYVGAAG